MDTVARRRKAGSDKPRVRELSASTLRALREPDRRTLPAGIQVGEFYVALLDEEVTYQPFHHIARSSGLSVKVRMMDELLVFRFKRK